MDYGMLDASAVQVLSRKIQFRDWVQGRTCNEEPEAIFPRIFT